MYLVEILRCGAAVASSSIVKCARHEAFSCSSLFRSEDAALRGVWMCTCHRDLRCMALLCVVLILWQARHFRGVSDFHLLEKWHFDGAFAVPVGFVVCFSLFLSVLVCFLGCVLCFC